MIVAGNMETRRFMKRLREEADKLKDLRRKAKKDRFPMRLARHIIWLYLYGKRKPLRMGFQS